MGKDNNTNGNLTDPSGDFNQLIAKIDQIFIDYYSDNHNGLILTIDELTKNITKKEVDRCVEKYIKNKTSRILIKTPPSLSKLGSEMNLTIELDHYCRGKYAKHKEINTKMWEQIPKKLSNPLIIIEDIEITGGKKNEDVYDIFLDLDDEMGNKILCVVRDDKRNNMHSLFFDTAYAEFKPKKPENPDTNIDLSKINDKEEYNTVYSEYLYKAVEYDINSKNKKKKIKFIDPENFFFIIYTCIDEKLNQLFREKYKSKQYLLNPEKNNYEDVNQDFQKWIIKFQNIVLRLPELKKRKEEVKSVICFMIENFSKKLDVEKPKEDQKHNTYVTEDFEFSLGPFTESGSNESTYKRDDEEDDEDEGE